jgi:hypothetical protein
MQIKHAHVFMPNYEKLHHFLSTVIWFVSNLSVDSPPPRAFILNYEEIFD